MQLTILASGLALAGAAFANPVPTNDNSIDSNSYQKQIQDMEITIINITNDIVQNNANLKTDYDNGIKQFVPLINGLQGPQPCSIFTPGNPNNKDQAVSSLQQSNLSLMNLSLDLMNAANKVEDGALHADVCQAWAWYNAIGKFVGV